MKKIPYLKTSLVFIAVFIALMVVKSLSEAPATEQPTQNGTQPVDVAASRDDSLVEDKRVYEGHNGNEVKHVYVTIFDQASAPDNDISFYELNESYKEYSNLDDGPKLNILFQTGTADGPEKNGFIELGKSTPNATIELRGRSSRRHPQKSYKIKLNDSGGLWFGQDTLNLNKHYDDPTKVRNKLAFDLFKEIPDFMSLRTDFVQLHVKDLTNVNSDGSFQDYGLYTHVEQLNEDALAARGLNPDGHLYKAENFEFHRYPDQLKLTDDPTYDKKAFETVLKISGKEQHEELLTMLDDVNDMTIPFDEVFDQYFNEGNYLTWLAVNILMGNYDTMSTNYYLYSPLNSDKWYFIPWDFDKALGLEDELKSNLPSWQLGIQRYWGTVIHKRYLRDPENVEKLTAKIEEISSQINKESTKKLIEGYYPIVKPYISRNPDLTYLNIEASQFEGTFNRLQNVTGRYKDLYYKSLEHPMPIFLNYQRKGSRDIFTWEPSHDLQEDRLTYHFKLSRDPKFESPLIDIDDARNFTVDAESLSPGRYYWQVLIKDEDGHTQIPFDYYKDNKNITHWGVQEIIVPKGASQ